MKIIQTTTTDRKTLYQLTKGANLKRIQDSNGEKISVKNYVLYEDTKNNGEVYEILSIEAQDGSMYATNSRTFKEAFLDIATICGGPADMIGETVLVTSGTSKAGRTFYTCTWA